MSQNVAFIALVFLALASFVAPATAAQDLANCTGEGPHIFVLRDNQCNGQDAPDQCVNVYASNNCNRIA